MQQEARELMAFMEAIAKNPRDVQTRQVFADWLEDHDEPLLANEQRKFDLDKYDAELRLRKFADRYAAGDYEDMIEGIRRGKYCFSDDGYRCDMDDQFWDDIGVILGKTTDEEKSDLQDSVSFRCGC